MDLREMLLEYTKNEGREEGREEGRKEGRKEGREEGRVGAATAVIKNLIVDLNLPDEQIASVVGVSIEFVSQVRNKLGK